MTAVPDVLRLLQQGEQRLEAELLAVGERHSDEHEVRHVTVDLARWSRQNLDALGGTGVAQPEPGDRELLEDLRHLHLLATGNAVHWTVLEQVAKATRDDALLALVEPCADRTRRQAAWCLAMVKAVSPQALVSPQR